MIDDGSPRSTHDFLLLIVMSHLLHHQLLFYVKSFSLYRTTKTKSYCIVLLFCFHKKCIDDNGLLLNITQLLQPNRNNCLACIFFQHLLQINIAILCVMSCFSSIIKVEISSTSPLEPLLNHTHGHYIFLISCLSFFYHWIVLFKCKKRTVLIYILAYLFTKHP